MAMAFARKIKARNVRFESVIVIFQHIELP